MSQEWAPNHYHFLIEHLPRIMVFLDVLRKHEDIKVWSKHVLALEKYIENIGVKGHVLAAALKTCPVANLNLHAPASCRRRATLFFRGSRRVFDALSRAPDRCA